MNQVLADESLQVLGDRGGGEDEPDGAVWRDRVLALFLLNRTTGFTKEMKS